MIINYARTLNYHIRDKNSLKLENIKSKLLILRNPF